MSSRARGCDLVVLVCLYFVDGAVRVMRWGVEAIDLQRFATDVGDVVPHTFGYQDDPVIGHFLVESELIFRRPHTERGRVPAPGVRTDRYRCVLPGRHLRRLE